MSSAFLLAIALAASTGPATARPHPGQLVNPDGVALAPGDLARAASGTDFVLVGETHSFACDHLAQAAIVESLAAAGNRPAIGLEMVAVDQQPPLDLFNERRIEASRMDEALLWEQFWGFPFELYLPIFRAAERWDLPVVALNVPGYTERIVLGRQLDPQWLRPRRLWPERIVPPPPEQIEALREIFESHGGIPSPDDGADPFERFLFVQSLWDSKMAEESLRANERLGRPVVVLAGSGHVENGWGIAHRMDVLAPEARVLSILPWRGIDPPEKGSADLFYFCPLDE